MATQVVVLVGTNRGAFFFHSDEGRRDWRMTGPHLPGWEVYSLLGDSRHGKRIFAGTSHLVFGTSLRVSDDMGETWTEIADGPRYSPESGFKLNRIWQLVPGGPDEPDTLYAGVDEAGLFASRDRGATWQEVSGLTSHPTRPNWSPSNGGLCLHTILPDPTNPRRMWVAVSVAGIFRTDDGGATWQIRNMGLPYAATGTVPSEVDRSVHKLVLDPRQPDTLYVQLHTGVFKSTDSADSWQPIETGLPSRFAFPMVVTPNGDLFLIPLADNMMRTFVDGKLRVYRSRDGGASWAPSGEGLPTEPHYSAVLRDAMAVDTMEPAGVYFGTSAGEVFASPDAGDHWARLPGNFPRITAVKTWVYEV